VNARAKLATVAVLPVIALGACGGDEGPDAAATTPTEAVEQSTETPATSTATSTANEPVPTDAPGSTDVPDATAAPDHADETDETVDAVEMVQGGGVDAELLVPAYLGAAPFQDVAVAEAAGWVSTAETLGCFEDAERGGMGVHWLNESLLDAELDASRPEALVYELDADGNVAGLVGHEYLVPFEAWAADAPPTLFGLDLHEHPVLPFWILHTYLWKDNPNGMFSDFNPAVRMCPDGVGVFGVDLP